MKGQKYWDNLSFEENTIVSIAVYGLLEHLKLEEFKIVFTEQPPEGEKLHIPGCAYNPVLKEVYIHRLPEYSLGQLVGLAANCLYEVKCLQNRGTDPVIQAEADIFGDFYQSLITNDPEYLKHFCNAEHFRILYLQDAKYQRATLPSLFSLSKEPDRIIMALRNHYVRMAWLLFDGEQLLPVTEELSSFVDSSDVIFSPALYITLLTASPDEHIKQQNVVRSAAARYHLETVFDSLVSLFDDLREQNNENETVNRLTEYTDLPDGAVNLLCGAYLADDGGIRLTDEKNDEEIIVSKTPISILRILNQYGTDQKQLVIGYKQSGWKTFVLRAEALSSVPRLKNEFGSRTVYSDHYDLLSKYLITLVQENQTGRLRNEPYVDKLGWKDLEFIPYSDVYRCRIKDPVKKHIQAAVNSTGSFSLWKKVVNHLRESHYTLVKIALAASFSSVLKELHQSMSNTYIVSFHGAPASGKSILLGLGASIWGDPNYLVGSFNETKAALYEKAAFLSDLPIFLDDSNNTIIPTGREFGLLIYDLFRGVGKLKLSGGNALSEEPRWNACSIITGEHPAKSFVSMDQKGAVTRIIDIPTPAKIFNSPDTYKTISDISRKHYGYAGRIFVETIKRMGPELISDLFRRYVELLERLTITQHFDARFRYPVASLLLADRIASIAVYEDETSALTVSELISAVQEKHVAEDPYSDCLSDIISNKESLVEQEVAILDDNHPEYLVLPKEHLRELTSRHSLEVNEFALWMKGKELLLTDKNKTTKNKRIEKKAIPMYYIKVTDLKKTAVIPTVEDMELEKKKVASISAAIHQILTKDRTEKLQKEAAEKTAISNLPINIDQESVLSYEQPIDTEQWNQDGLYITIAKHFSLFRPAEYDELLRILQNCMKNNEYTRRFQVVLLSMIGILNESYIKRPNVVRALEYYQDASEKPFANPMLSEICTALRYFQGSFQSARVGKNWGINKSRMNECFKEHLISGVVYGIYQNLTLPKTPVNHKDKDFRLRWDEIEKEIRYLLLVAEGQLSEEELKTAFSLAKHLVRFYHPELVILADEDELDDFVDEYLTDPDFQDICNDRWAYIIQQYRDFIPFQLELLLLEYSKKYLESDNQSAQLFMQSMIGSENIQHHCHLPETFLQLAANQGNIETRLALVESDEYLTEEMMSVLVKDPDIKIRGWLTVRREVLSYPGIVDALLADEDEEVRQSMQATIDLHQS